MKKALPIIASSLIAFPVFSIAQEKLAPRNNWTFTENYKEVTKNWLLVTIDINNNEKSWDIFDIQPLSKIEIHRDSSIEPFVVSPDFQKWTNYYTNNIGNCDSFGVQNSETKNICFSKFSRKNVKKALIGVFFGGSGEIGVSYDEDMINNAIRSIDTENAIKALEKYESRLQ